MQRALYHGRRKALKKGRVQQYRKVLKEGDSAAEGLAIVEGYKGEESSAAESTAITEGFREREGSAAVDLEGSCKEVSSSVESFGYFGRESSTWGVDVPRPAQEEVMLT